ncbi:MAG: signal recognition particle protein [bacterium]|nr:signal recognition particle protein [bacterium]
MFDSLTQRLNSVFDKLKSRGALSEADVDAALREVRVALLEADVALSVAKGFIQSVREKAVGEEVLSSITPGQMVIKIVHDQLVELLGSETAEISLDVTPPALLMMVGLQGSGKTTSTAKLALHLQKKHNKKVLMASLDIYRPAAQEQLAILGRDHDIGTLPIVEGHQPLEIAKRAEEMGRLEGYDVVLLDTAGRLHIDETLMAELKGINKALPICETLLVGDAMTGQDAVNMAKAFHEQLALTGIILTRIDGDARGGAALSMRSITGCPIKFVGVGERPDQFEIFHPDRMANRILGMGDVVTLVEKASENLDQVQAEKLAKKVQKGRFDLNDLSAQLGQMGKMGGLGAIAKMMPGMGKMQSQMAASGMDDKMVSRNRAVISSMTPKERKDPKVLNGSRKRRIAAGSGVQVPDVNRLLKQFKDMQTMMKRMSKMGEKGLKRHGIASLFKR